MDTGHVRLSGKAGAVAYDAKGRAERGGKWFEGTEEIDGSKIGASLISNKQVAFLFSGRACKR